VVELHNIHGNLFCRVQETEQMTSIELSADGNFALVHLLSQKIRLWDLNNTTIVREYFKTNTETTQVFLQACFGINDSLILSGSKGMLNYFSGFLLYFIHCMESRWEGLHLAQKRIFARNFGRPSGYS
jgi:hypothetical protein